MRSGRRFGSGQECGDLLCALLDTTFKRRSNHSHHGDPASFSLFFFFKGPGPPRTLPSSPTPRFSLFPLPLPPAGRGRRHAAFLRGRWRLGRPAGDGCFFLVQGGKGGAAPAPPGGRGPAGAVPAAA